MKNKIKKKELSSAHWELWIYLYAFVHVLSSFPIFKSLPGQRNKKIRNSFEYKSMNN